MKVIWEKDDLVELIISLKPALCDIVSKSGDHLILPILNTDNNEREADRCQITNFLIANDQCSVLVASFSEPESRRVLDMYKGFWVSANEFSDSIRLSYRIIPKESIKKGLETMNGSIS